MMRSRAMLPEHQSWLRILIDRYGAEHLIRQIKKKDPTKLGRRRHPPNARYLASVKFYFDVIAARDQLGTLKAAISSVANSRKPRLSNYDTAQKYYRTGRSNFFSFVRSSKKSITAVWSGPELNALKD
jgi:hypothetical protein